MSRRRWKALSIAMAARPAQLHLPLRGAAQDFRWIILGRMCRSGQGTPDAQRGLNPWVSVMAGLGTASPYQAPPWRGRASLEETMDDLDKIGVAQRTKIHLDD
jgi:hypothetical protein